MLFTGQMIQVHKKNVQEASCKSGQFLTPLWQSRFFGKAQQHTFPSYKCCSWILGHFFTSFKFVSLQQSLWSTITKLKRARPSAPVIMKLTSYPIGTEYRRFGFRQWWQDQGSIPQDWKWRKADRSVLEQLQRDSEFQTLSTHEQADQEPYCAQIDHHKGQPEGLWIHESSRIELCTHRAVQVRECHQRYQNIQWHEKPRRLPTLLFWRENIRHWCFWKLLERQIYLPRPLWSSINFETKKD